MRRVLGFVDDSPCTTSVISTAESLGRLLNADVDLISVEEPGHGPPERTHGVRMVTGDAAEVLAVELAAHDVAFAVMGSRSTHTKSEPLGHVTNALLQSSPVPLAIVPPSGESLPQQPRLLVPLDGTGETTTAVRDVAERLTEAGANIVGLHVYDSSSVPPFVDSLRNLETIAEEFAERHLPGRTERCELRIGDPGLHIIELAQLDEIDGIILAWHQRLSAGRAEVLRYVLRQLSVPILIIPIKPAPLGRASSPPERLEGKSPPAPPE